MTIHADRPRRRRGFGNLLPLFLAMGAVALADQALLRSPLLDVDKMAALAWVQRWHETYRAVSAVFDPARPQLVIAGNSRAQEIWPEYLEPPLREAGLPHQVSNLGIGGGAVALSWAAMRDLSPYTRQWPKGSRLVFLMTAADLFNVPLDLMASFPGGRDFLARYYDEEAMRQRAAAVPLGQLSDPTLRALYPYSGLVQFVLKAEVALPKALADFRRLRFNEPVLIERNFANTPPPPPTCKEPPAEFHPGAVAAFREMAEHFGRDLVVVVAPIRDAEARCERPALERSLVQVREWQRLHGFALVEDPATIMTLPPSVWDRDPTHIRTEQGRSIAARAIVGLVK